METNNFIKIYIKYFIIISIFMLVLLLSILGYNNLKLDYNKINDNYYDNNKIFLNNIQFYIDNNKLQGSIYVDIDKDISEYFNTGELYKKCITNNLCDLNGISLSDTLKQLSIKRIVAYKRYIGILPLGQKDIDISGIGFYLNKDMKLYGCKDNYIYYSKDFYRGKKELESADGNKYHVISRIFNNDWGIINGCYGCD